ncbi:MAG: carbohydrate ABC transporter permease [Oscillospiraceae bacterium]|nr:carbohydrate ABC transporter permease [Oscillospiraceae bacterium]
MVNTTSAKVQRVIVYSVVVLLVVVYLVPVYFAFINSLREPISVPVTSPFAQDRIYWDNYYSALIRIPFFRFLSHSLFISGIAVSLAVVMNFMFGFAFARLNAPYKNLWFTVLISLMMIPETATLIPQYVLFSQLKLTNSFWIWVVLGLAGSPFYTFLYRQFIQGIPNDLMEAARIDGASIPRIMLSIFVPLCKPVITIVFMFEFIFSWGDVMRPFMFLSSNLWPLACTLMGTYFSLPQRPENVLQPLQLAASFVFIIPSFLVYLIGQKNVREGMITSGLKA